MTLFDRYLISQQGKITLFCILLFTVIWLAPETLFKLVQHMFANRITPLETLQLFVLHMPNVLQQTLPMSVFLGSVFLFRQLSQHMELIGFFVGRISTIRILTPVFLLGIFFGLLHIGIQEFVTPLAAEKITTMTEKAGIERSREQTFLFVDKKENDEVEKIFLISQASRETLHGFMLLYFSDPIREKEPGSTHQKGHYISRILRANTGHWDPADKVWHLEDGIDYELDRSGVYRKTRTFETQQVNTNPYAVEMLNFLGMKPKNMSLGSLLHYVSLLEKSGQDQELQFFWVRLQHKLIAPLAAVLFAVLGALLGMEAPRTPGLATLINLVIVLFVYSVMVPTSIHLGTMGLLPSWLAAWVPILGASFTTWGVMKLRGNRLTQF